MRAFKTQFPIKGVPTFVTITQLEEEIFAIVLESTSMEESTITTVRNYDLLVQHTKNGTWIILYRGSFDLNNEDLQALGRAIENDAPNPV